MMDTLGKIITERRLRRQCLRAWSNVYKEEPQCQIWYIWAPVWWGQGWAAWSQAHSLASLTQHITQVRNALLSPWAWARHRGADARTGWTGNTQELPVVVIAWRRFLRVKWGPWEPADPGQPEASHETGCPGSAQTLPGIVNSLCM